MILISEKAQFDFGHAQNRTCISKCVISIRLLINRGSGCRDTKIARTERTFMCYGSRLLFRNDYIFLSEKRDG